MRPKISRKRAFGSATYAIWNTTHREWPPFGNAGPYEKHLYVPAGAGYSSPEMAKDRQDGKAPGDNRPPDWRGRFGPDETIQRVRPTETFRYLPNPHKGTTTFQRFNGDPLFPGLIWNDR
jgi:hypothetical protein